MLEVRNLRFQYHAADEMTFDGLNLTIEQGVFLAVVGPSGSGKSTLLRTFNGLVPHFHGGRFGGSVSVRGASTRDKSTADLSRVAGYVGQEPESQTIFDSVADEVAFGPENLEMNAGEIERQVDSALQSLDIGHLRERDISTLSGGERQRVVIAATLAMGSRLLVLDEPLSQLDPWASNDLLRTLSSLNREHGVTVVIAEHRIDRVLPHCTHVLELPAPDRDVPVQPIASALPGLRSTPTVVQLAQRLEWPSLPQTTGEARDLHLRSGQALVQPARQRAGSRPEILRAEGITVERASQSLVEDVSLSLRSGSILALMGANGSGKTTLLRALAGFQKISQGSIHIDRKPLSSFSESAREAIGYVPQHPAALFLGLTVREEIDLALHGNSNTRIPEAILDRFGLADLADRNSFDISGGEQQRLALAIASAQRPAVLLLDEPTRGMDQRAIEHLKQLLKGLTESGTSIVLATHDSDLTASCADQVMLLRSGRAVLSGSPAEAFALEPVLMTDVGRVLGSGFLTLSDVEQCLLRQQNADYARQHQLSGTTPD